MNVDANDAVDPGDIELLQAIRVVQRHLRQEWISEGCRVRPAWGCASCQAVELDRQLDMLAAETRENHDIPPHI